MDYLGLSRYASGGVLNTLVGFAIIFLLMGLGLFPTLSNVGGYLVGLIFGFFAVRRRLPLREYDTLPHFLSVLTCICSLVAWCSVRENIPHALSNKGVIRVVSQFEILVD